MHTKPRRGAVAAAAAVIGIALASSSTMLGAVTATVEKDGPSGVGATWGVEDVRFAFDLGKQLKEPRIAVLVSAPPENTEHHIAAQWLAGTTATDAEHILEVKPFVVAAPIALSMGAAWRPSVWDAMLAMDKGLTFEAFEGEAMMGVIAQFNEMLWAGRMQSHLKSTGKAKYAALPRISETAAKEWASTRFALTQIPALVHSASGGIGNKPFVLEEVKITKDDEGNLFVGQAKADSTKAEALLTAAGWEKTMIACVVDLGPKTPCGGARLALGEQVASMERPETFVDWYEKRFPRKEETLLEKIFAPRIP